MPTTTTRPTPSPATPTGARRKSSGAIAATSAPIDADLLFLVNQAGFALTAEMAASLGTLGISPREFCVLSHALKGETTQIRLAELSALDKTTMVVTLDRLEKAGLAERKLSGTDRRARIVAVTPAGQRTVAQAQQIVAGMYADILAVLPAGDREVFLRSMITLVGSRLARPSHTERPARSSSGR